MDRLAKDLEQYLSEVLGLGFNLEPLKTGNLPFYLNRQYEFYRLIVGATAMTAVFLREEGEFMPARFIKQMRQVPFFSLEETCVVARMLPAYVRKRMIETGISFVIPGVQMYLPRLGMELRARSPRNKSKVFKRFKPASQVVLIYWLVGKIKGDVSPLTLSRQLGYSAMSMGRALDELESAEIARIKRAGRERLFNITASHQEIWQKCQDRLNDPITKVIRVRECDLQQRDALLPAGLYALSKLTMLNEPVHPVYAISRAAWKVMEKSNIEMIPVEEPGTCLLQIWRYDPIVLAVDGHVDPFSLYLSLQNAKDERIEKALEEMMERVKW